ncbi:unnamed protein product [Rhizoctonia solani]|uniref:CBM1 domain-containing protein n=1 Tax=Rhizoctonia solani TaxID=456999 RepID=A0A8H3AZU2_9AGAM|nr:unnamed protein product [Rhizoctonia solani]
MKLILRAVIALVMTITISAAPLPDPAPLGGFCGGIIGIQCEKGLVCKLEGNFPDAGGICVKKGYRAK